MSKSTYYYEISRKDAVAERNAALTQGIKDIFAENRKRYGVRRVYRELWIKPLKSFRISTVLFFILIRDGSTSMIITGLLWLTHGIIQSMSRKGNCYDNCIMETFFGRLKNEMYYGHKKNFRSFKEFSDAINEYIDYYNNKRIQVKTKWMPPAKYRQASIQKA